MAFAPWFTENFQPYVVNTDLDTQGGWSKVSDTSGGKAKIIVKDGVINPTGNKGVHIFAPNLTSEASYHKSVSQHTEYELFFKIKLLQLGDPGKAFEISLDDGVFPTATFNVGIFFNATFAPGATTWRVGIRSALAGFSSFVALDPGVQHHFRLQVIDETTAIVARLFLSLGGGPFVQIASVNVSSATANLIHMRPNTNLFLPALNIADWALDDIEANFLVPPIPPSPPLNLVATGGIGQVSLSWSAPSNPGSDPISGYKIFRSITSGAEIFLTTIGNITNFIDTAVINGQEFFYKVTALSAAGESTESNEDSAIPVAPPSPPLNLRVVAEDSQNTLTWDPPINPGGIITAYKVYRATASGILATKAVIATLGNILTFTDIGLTNGTTYYYQVTASTNLEGSESNEANGTPSSNAIPAIPKNVSVNQRKNYAVLSWGRVTEREDGHSIASDAYATKFEPPVFAIADLKDQDGWKQTVSTAVGVDIIVQSSVVISDLQSAQYNFIPGNESSQYDKPIPTISFTAYEVVWKWFLDTIVADPHTYQIEIAGAGRWNIALLNDGEIQLNVGDGFPIKTSADVGNVHEYKLRRTRSVNIITGIPTLFTDLFVDNILILSKVKIGDDILVNGLQLRGTTFASFTNGSGFIDDIAVKLIGLADVAQYNIFRSLRMNESDRKQIATITTKDIENFVDTAFIDLNSNDVKIYRVSAVILDAGNQLESSLSNRAVAIKLPSQIDQKEEVLDRRIMRWGTGTWGQLWGG